MKENYKGYTIKIKQDEYAESPREWSTFGTIVSATQGINEVERWINDSIKDAVNCDVDIEKALAKHFGEIAVVLPIYRYSHGVDRFSTESFYGKLPQGHARFDSALTGFIFATKETTREWFKCKRVTEKIKQQAAENLKSEIDDLDTWASGDVWGYIVEDDEEEHVDSCWGYYNYEYALQAAKFEIDLVVKQINEAPETRQPVMALLD